MVSPVYRLMALAEFTTLAFAITHGNEPPINPPIEKRAYFEDSYKIFLRKRNAHACMMSIVFIVLFPLGAIAQHLPLKGVRVTSRIHAPIQLLGLAMMIGATGLGIDIAKNGLNYFTPIRAHVAIGLVVTCTIIVVQPAMGILQHRYFKRTGGKSVFAHVHRWTGRVMICLGWINSGLGFQLVGIPPVKTHSLVRNFVIMAVLGGMWFLLVGADGLRYHFWHKSRLSSYRVGWSRGLRLYGSDVNGDARPSSKRQETTSSRG